MAGGGKKKKKGGGKKVRPGRKHPNIHLREKREKKKDKSFMYVAGKFFPFLKGKKKRGGEGGGGGEAPPDTKKGGGGR